MRSALILALAVAASGCQNYSLAATTSGGATDAANVVVLKAASNARTGATAEIIATELQNTGGSGTYKIEFWGPAPTANQVRLVSSSDVITVGSNYHASVGWTIAYSSPITSSMVTYLVVYSRDQNSTSFRQTAKYMMN